MEGGRECKWGCNSLWLLLLLTISESTSDSIEECSSFWQCLEWWWWWNIRTWAAPWSNFGVGDRISKSSGLLFFQLSRSKLRSLDLLSSLLFFRVWPLCPHCVRAESGCDLTLFLLAIASDALCEQILLLVGKDADFFFFFFANRVWGCCKDAEWGRREMPGCM